MIRGGQARGTAQRLQDVTLGRKQCLYLIVSGMILEYSLTQTGLTSDGSLPPV